MKFFIQTSLLYVCVLLCACGPVYNYQVLSATSLDEKKIISFENEDIRINYDFWENKGRLKIKVQNKTELPLFLDLSQSALILNGVAFPVYQDKELTWSLSAARGKSVSYFDWYGFLETPQITKGISFTQTLKPNPIVYLPANSTAIRTLLPGELAYKYDGTEAKLRRGEKSKTLAFTRERSPYRYLFSLSYSRHKNLQEIKTIEDEFWVESIIVLREKGFNGELKDRYNWTMPYQKENAFYVQYPVGGFMQ